MSWCTNSGINVLNMHSNYIRIYVPMAVIEITMQEITKLDAVKFYTYPATCIGICM